MSNNSCKKSDLCSNTVKHSKLSINNKCFSIYQVLKMQFGASYPWHLSAGCLHKAIKEKGKGGRIITSSFLISVIYFGRNFLKRWLIALDKDPNSACETCTGGNEF